MPRNIHKRKGGGARRTDYYGAAPLRARMHSATKVSGICSSIPNKLGRAQSVEGNW